MKHNGKISISKKALMICSGCGREFRGCSLRLCPNSEKQFKFESIYGKFVCMHCCKPCKESYWERTGQKCRISDKKSLKESEC